MDRFTALVQTIYISTVVSRLSTVVVLDIVVIVTLQLQIARTGTRILQQSSRGPGVWAHYPLTGD